MIATREDQYNDYIVHLKGSFQSSLIYKDISSKMYNSVDMVGVNIRRVYQPYYNRKYQ